MLTLVVWFSCFFHSFEARQLLWCVFLELTEHPKMLCACCMCRSTVPMPVSTVMGNIDLMMIGTRYAGKHFLFFRVTSLWHHNISDEPHKSLCGSGQRAPEKKGLVTLVFLRAKVQKAFTLIQINHTNSAFAPQLILIKPNLHSANTLSVSQIIQSKGSKIQCSRTKKRNTPKV